MEAVKSDIPDAVKDFISARAEVLENRVQRLEEDVRIISAKVKALERETSEHSQDIDQLKRATSILMDKTTRLEEEVDKRDRCRFKRSSPSIIERTETPLSSRNPHTSSGLSFITIR
ncbi:MAG: hypothetical protein DRO36_05715 [Candidatus Hecatellales archaeon]|nr:MAG: hypothetical protein DRO36_05715 [Candidatus Hecatellales archaeon]